MSSRHPSETKQGTMDWQRFLSRFDLNGMKTILDESPCPFHGEDEAFSARRVIDATDASDLSDGSVVHTLWHCLGCGACTAGAKSPGSSFAALALQARRFLVARGERMPSLFRGAFASLGRLADQSGGLRPARLIGEPARTWPEGKTLFWTGRMGLAAALFDAPEAARVRGALIRSFQVLEEAGLEPAVLDPEPTLDFESAWWGDRETFLRRAGVVAETFQRLGSVEVVTADPLSALLLRWVLSQRGMDVSVQPFVERWAEILGRAGAHAPKGEPVAILPEPVLNLSFLTEEPVLDTWSPPSLSSLVRTLGYEPVALFFEETRRRPGMVSVGLRSLAMMSARSAALCRQLLQEADRLHARKVLVADPMSWAALAEVSRTGTWRQAQARPILPGELEPVPGREA